MYQLGSSMLVQVEYIWFGYEEKTKRDRVSNLIEDEKKKVIECDVGIIFKVLKPDRTVRFDQDNLEPLIFTVLLASRTVLWEKNRDPYESRLDLTVLRTMIRPLLTVTCFPLNLNLKKKKKNTHTHTQEKK